MGLISWIKNKYYEGKFQKASRLLSEGDVSDAIELLKSILQFHQEAPSTLLSIYHEKIKGKDNDTIREVSALYKEYNELKAEIISFASEISNTLLEQAVKYTNELYSAGIKELEKTFVKAGTQYVLIKTHIDNLNKITQDRVLLKALSEALFEEAKNSYNNSQLGVVERICTLIYPYLNSKDFYDLYANVRFDVISKNQINASSIADFDLLFKDVKSKFNLSNQSIKKLTDKGLKKAKDCFNEKDYVASLLISQRLVDKYSDAKKLYGDSALKLYSSSNEDNLVLSEILYKSLGNSDTELLDALEAFIPYGNHKDKYIETASKELKRLMQIKIEDATKLFSKVWALIQDKDLIKALLTSGNSANKNSAATFLITNFNEITSVEIYFNTLVTSLLNLEDVNYIVSTLEAFITKGKKVEREYISQIKRLAEESKEKSKKRVEIIEHGLSVTKSDELFLLQGVFLNDYINSGKYDVEYAFNVALSLKGKSPLSEPLQAKILIDEAINAKEMAIKEQKLREALYFKNKHDKIFDINSYQNILPIIETQLLELGSRYFDSNRKKATEIFFLLRDNDLNWYEKYAQLNLNYISQHEPKLDDASLLLTIIKEGSDFNYKIKEQLWNKYAQINTSILSKLNLDDEIDGLLKLKNELDNLCTSSNKVNLINSINTILFEKYLIRGKQSEKNKLYSKALSDYEEASLIAGNNSEIQCRIIICKIKSKKSITKSDKDIINKNLVTNNGESYQRDLAYRWCLDLIANNQFELAEELNSRILEGDSEIAQICQEKKIKHQQVILDTLNNQIEKLNNSQLTPEDALSLGKSLSRILNEISLISNVSSQYANTLKETIRVYAIEKFYANEEYLKCIKGLKVHDSTYLTDPIALRNIAIMCLGVAESDMLDDNNYKEFLSIWATAIYQQKIFVDSLDYTSWDDPYTFSLDEALGQLDNNDDELPDNVNYSDSNESGVVSIREVQRALLSRMEGAIKDNSIYQQFLSGQLEAMDMLAEQELDEECVLVAPYLLTLSNNYRNNVTHALTTEEKGHYGNWETILKIGNLYGLKDGIFGTYSQAIEYQKNAVESITHNNQINRSFATARINCIRQFENLMNDLIASVTTSLNNDISNETDYNILARSYGEVIKIIAEDSLTFVFSNYINQQVVKRLNDKTLSLSQGAPILFEIYDYCKCNPHLKRNLDNIIEALIHNFITDGDTNNLTILDKVLSNTREFDQQVISALKGGDGVPEEMMPILFSSNMARFNSLKTRIGSKSTAIQKQFNETTKKIEEFKVVIELNEIIEKVNNNTMTKKVALEKVYNIYKNNKNNARVCQNLATLIPMCVMEYIIPNKPGKVSVENILDSLKLNRSLTFNSHNSEIRQAYNEIWGQLPYDLKNVIQNQPWMLSAQGEAIKKGIDYLKALS